MMDFFRHYAGGIYHRFGEHRIFLLSGGLAFSFLVCVVPLVLVFLAVLGNILIASSFEYQVEVIIEILFPYTEYAAAVKAFLLARMAEIVAYRHVAGYSGAFGLLLASSSLFGSMRTILNKVFQIRRGRHPVVGKLRDFGMVVLVLIFFLTSTTIFPLLEFIRKSAHKIAWLQLHQLDASVHGLFSILFFIIIFFVFFILYYFVPYEKIGRVPAAVGAMIATVLWEIAKQIFGYYLADAASLSKIYGAYIFIVVLLLWIYYSALIFILGAEISQLYREPVPSQEREATDDIDTLDF